MTQFCSQLETVSLKGVSAVVTAERLRKWRTVNQLSSEPGWRVVLDP